MGFFRKDIFVFGLIVFTSSLYLYFWQNEGQATQTQSQTPQIRNRPLARTQPIQSKLQPAPSASESMPESRDANTSAPQKRPTSTEPVDNFRIAGQGNATVDARLQSDWMSGQDWKASDMKADADWMAGQMKTDAQQIENQWMSGQKNPEDQESSQE